MNLALKLSKEVKDRMAELEALSDKARDGDKEAMRELRQALRNPLPRSSPGPPTSPTWGSGY